MIKKLLVAGALLAFPGAIASSASAAVYHTNPAFRVAAAYHGSAIRARFPQARRVIPAARVAVRFPARAAAAPRARAAYVNRLAPQVARPAGRFATAYRVTPHIARPAYARFAYAYRSAAYRRLAAYRALAPATAVQRVAVAPSYVAPRVTAAPRVASIPAPVAVGAQVGGASYYSGGRTASGGFVGAATCAHRSLPFGTRLLVTNMSNARATVCVVNDRGPFIGGRIVDLSRGAAGAIGMIGAGIASVRLQIVGRS